jgi:hypothetical protein
MRTWWLVVVMLLAVASSAAAGSAHVFQEKVTDDVTVSIYTHEIDTFGGKVQAWTFVSHGLSASHQAELRLTVKREPDEKDQDYPRDVLDYYRHAADLAAKGQLVGVGDTAEMKVGLLGRSDFRCLLYAPAQPFDDVPVEGPSLQALIVTCNEVSSADHFGYLRVMARLGQAQRWYPTTPWIDRKRAEVIGPHGDDGSVLVGKRLVRTTVRARREGDKLVMLVLDDGTDEMKRMFKQAPHGGLALALSYDPSADSYLVWSPGQKDAAAIASPNSKGARLGCNFLVIADGAAKDVGVLAEDGMVAQFTPASWKDVRNALEQGKPLTLPLQHGSFEIRWIPTKAGVHGTNGSYEATKGFDSYAPDVPAPAPTGPIAMERVLLLNPNDELAGMTTVEALAGLLKQIEAEAIAEGAATPVKGKLDLMIDLSCDGSKNTMSLAFRTGTPQPFATELLKRLDKLPVLAVKRGTVHVQLFFRINGGTGQSF